MDIISYFSAQPELSEIPDHCPNPFDNNPHPLAIRASKELQQKLNQSAEISASLSAKEGGKMFGVLVVADQQNRIGYLSAFSGMLNKQWEVDGFVPPVFDIQIQQSFLTEGESQLKKLTDEIYSKTNNPLRLKALTRLNKLAEQQNQELDQLIQQNKINRALRRNRRLELQDSTSAETLSQLSFQSQQDKKALKEAKSNWAIKQSEASLMFHEKFDNEIIILKNKRKKLSQYLHKKVFENYQLLNPFGETRAIRQLFNGKVPPGGSGDCAAPKLIQFAHKHQLKILALAEFWWGASPSAGIRHHGSFYPPCRGKCYPILPFMLKGLISTNHSLYKTDYKKLFPQIIYEDDSILVLDKPSGLLSVPGKEHQHSVLNWLRQNFPQATGGLLLHRLDMATSGLLLAAKNPGAYKKLQQQFIKRKIKKRYVAILTKAIDEKQTSINLPLRVDLDDRPRQMVCYEHGKSALTQLELISRDAKCSRVYFYPLTGRTHQLRVHAAHSRGLNAPIKGDELYGTKADRLYLHAEMLTFEHPVTGKLMEMTSKVPF